MQALWLGSRQSAAVAALAIWSPGCCSSSGVRNSDSGHSSRLSGRGSHSISHFMSHSTSHSGFGSGNGLGSSSSGSSHNKFHIVQRNAQVATGTYADGT